MTMETGNSWMIFAERMMSERDTAREAVFHLRAKVDELLRENTRLKTALDEYVEALAAEWSDRTVAPPAPTALPAPETLPTPPDPTFPDLLAHAMTAQKMTQGQLANRLTARRAETSRQAVSSWVRGASKPSQDRWSVLFTILKVPPEEQPRWIDLLIQQQTPKRPRKPQKA